MTHANTEQDALPSQGWNPGLHVLNLADCCCYRCSCCVGRPATWTDRSPTLPTTQEASSISNTPGCSVIPFFSVCKSVEQVCCCASCAPVPSRPPRCQTPARSASPERGASLHSRKCTCTPRPAPLARVLTQAQALCSVLASHSRRLTPCIFFATPTQPQARSASPGGARASSLCITGNAPAWRAWLQARAHFGR